MTVKKLTLTPNTDTNKEEVFMKKFFVLILVLAVGLIFAGCAKKAVVQPEQPAAPQEIVQKAVAPEPAEKKAETAKAEPAKMEAPVITKEEPKKAETIQAKEVVETKPTMPAFENIHFDFDKYYIRDDAKPTLQSVSDWLVKDKSAKMLLEGHCDEWGTNEYNLALGERRAKSTRDYLMSSGVVKDRLDMISFGEERPLCKEQNKECWQKNRRVQFVIKPLGGSGR